MITVSVVLSLANALMLGALLFKAGRWTQHVEDELERGRQERQELRELVGRPS